MATALQDARIHYPVHKHPPTHKPTPPPTRHPPPPPPEGEGKARDRYECEVCTRRRRHKNPHTTPQGDQGGCLSLQDPTACRTRPRPHPPPTGHSRQDQNTNTKRTFTMFPPMSIIHPDTRRDEDVCPPRRPTHQHHHPAPKDRGPPGPEDRACGAPLKRFGHTPLQGGSEIEAP
jgi:hypothetical protein